MGALLLSEPPRESLSIPDFRVFEGKNIETLSSALLDTFYSCQECQEWYRDYAQMSGQPRLDFIGSASLKTPHEVVAAKMRETLGFSLAIQKKYSTWEKVLSELINLARNAGVLVMMSRVVMNNRHRRLDLKEFRGFALSDEYAPLIFINGKDTEAARMFTLAHELAHLWLGNSALSNLETVKRPSRQRYDEREVWCNAVAAEFLVPLSALKEHLSQSNNNNPIDNLSELARVFKVSELVILRRLLDGKKIDREEFDAAYEEKKRAYASQESTPTFMKSPPVYSMVLKRVGRRFAQALVTDTLEGKTLYRDAFRMLGIDKTKDFTQLGSKVGVI